MSPIGMRDVRALLQEDILRLCRTLLPHGRREGRNWVAYNPVTNDGKKDWALKIAITGAAGAWKDWRKGDKGDVISLISYLRGLDGKETLAWAKAFLGITDMTDEQRAAVRVRAATEAKKSETRAEQREKWVRERARAIFDAATRIPKGSPAEIYFAARNCPLASVPHLSRNSLRFAPALEWWRGATYAEEGGRKVKVSAGPEFPAVIAALRDGHGLLTGVHCTFLAADGSGKAPVAKPKLMLGTAGGSVIRIADGPSGMACDAGATAPAGPLVICEGIEDALTIAIAVGDVYRVWAAASLAGLAHAPVGLASISEVIVAADNDWASPQAEAQLEAAIAALEGSGKRVEVVRSLVGKDFNDWIREDA